MMKHLFRKAAIKSIRRLKNLQHPGKGKVHLKPVASGYYSLILSMILIGIFYDNSTGLVYYDENVLHRCLWDENYEENPGRYLQTYKRMQEMNLIEKCKMIQASIYCS